MCDIATDSAVQQRTACMPWIIAGDLNVDSGTMALWCQGAIKKRVPCVSKSEWKQSEDAQKADFALSQGIALVPFKPWLGVHSPPCVSDIHDAVVVMGVLEAVESESPFTLAPLPNSAWSTSAGVTSHSKGTASSMCS